MIDDIRISLPAAHHRFLTRAVDVLAGDARIVGIAAGGSYLANAMDEGRTDAAGAKLTDPRDDARENGGRA